MFSPVTFNRTHRVTVTSFCQKIVNAAMLEVYLLQQCLVDLNMLVRGII